MTDMIVSELVRRRGLRIIPGSSADVLYSQALRFITYPHGTRTFIFIGAFSLHLVHVEATLLSVVMKPWLRPSFNRLVHRPPTISALPAQIMAISSPVTFETAPR
jgi:hypothetical protein